MSGNKPRHATLADVARAANVSVATAGRALGNYGYVRPEAKETILKAAHALNYRKNLAAQSLISGTAKTFGMIVSDIGTEFYSNIIKSVVNYCRGHGYCVLIYDTHESVRIEREALAIFQQHRVDGIIISPADSRNADHLREFVSSGGRIVQIDRCVPDLESDTVQLDNRRAARECTRKLIAAGHRRIGYIGELSEIRPATLRKLMAASPPASDARQPFAPSYQRLFGYLDAHHEAGLGVCLDLIGRTGQYSDSAANRETGKVLAHAPTALLTADGLMTVGAFRSIRAHGLRIPEDLSFISFDDLDWLQFVDPPVTAFAHPCSRIGEEAARILIRRVTGSEDSSSLHHEHVRLAGNLIERASIRTL
ncbi:LacI family DNA-binding transcriptional regulator [Komagataeibacter xylinus]|uniref:LacI family DNA-binding transcriptional regulator n=1 Tax=Komagataeibacter xylinus TaxID=28448 RepID=UPI00133004B6|nr:LacI family DNA-binding transcriptional regulator [Komagataeibacter xylinus]